MANTFKYGDIVSYKDDGGEMCILCPPPALGDFFSRKDYLAIDLVANTVLFLNEKEIIKIDEIEKGTNPCNPIFDPSIPLLSKVFINDLRLTGTVIAVNPILLPITFECEYLIMTERGKSVVAKSRDIQVLKVM